MSYTNPPRSPERPIRVVNLASKRAPLTPLRSFKPTPVKNAPRSTSASPTPIKVRKQSMQEPLFLDSSDQENFRAEERLNGKVESVIDAEEDLSPNKTHPTSPSPPAIPPSPSCLSDVDSDISIMAKRQPTRTPRRIMVSDSESEASPVAGPSKGNRIPIDMTESDSDSQNSVIEEDQTQAWKDKYYDDSLGSLRDFIVDDSESEEVSDGDDSDDSIRPARTKKSSKIIADKTPDLELPDFTRLTIVDSSDDEPEPILSRTIAAPTPRSKRTKKDWESERVRIAEDVFADLDKRVFESKLGSKGAGATIEWSTRLLTTAGTANQQKKRDADGTTSQVVKIVLSMKVCTAEEQILSTVAHEMCHLATWIISKEMKNPHGRIFKSWGRKVMKARKDIEVTTKHSYEIEYKFQWKCTKQSCARIYQRHSKSIDTEKDKCSRCGGNLEALFEVKKETAFQAYLKQNMGYAKQSLPGASHGVVMRALAKRWKDAGPDADHLAYWLAEIAS